MDFRVCILIISVRFCRGGKTGNSAIVLGANHKRKYLVDLPRAYVAKNISQLHCLAEVNRGKPEDGLVNRRF